MAAMRFFWLALILPVCTHPAQVPDRLKQAHQNLEGIASSKQNGRHPLSVMSRSKRAAVSYVNELDGNLLQESGHDAFKDILASTPGMFLRLGVNLSLPISDLMKLTFEYSSSNWNRQKDKLAEDLYYPYYSYAWKISLCNSRNALFETIIRLCSGGSFFGKMNEMLRNYKTNRYSNLRSYAFLLNVIVFEWQEVTQYTQTTYRGFSSGIEGYQMGLTFAWVYFATATKNITKACQSANTALFVIDNSANSNFRPRSLAEYSSTNDENEYVYPVAVLFHVDQIRTGACGDVTIPAIYISLEAGDYTVSGSRIITPPYIFVLLFGLLLAQLLM